MTYYDILEISERASQEVIRMAYKALCKKYHPDVYQGDKSYAEEQIKKINEAYDILSDVEKRREYDNSLKKQNNEKKNNENNYTTSNIEALLKRGFLSLEDGDWLKADDFFEEVLNRDAELAEAYLGKLMIDLRVNTREMLKNCAVPFDNKNNYIKALRFSDSLLKKFLVDTIQYINKRNYETECDITYMEACRLAKCDTNIESLENAIILFKKISNYKESSFKIKECEEKKQTLKEEIALKNQIEEVKRKRIIKLASIIIPTIAIVLTLAIIINTVITNNNKYINATQLIESEKYTEAITILEELDNYKDSQNLLIDTQYVYAKKLFEEDNFAESKIIFNKIASYKDSKKLIELCDDNINKTNYQKSIRLINEQKYIEAYALLEELATINYKDSKKLIQKHNKDYEQAVFNNKLKTAQIGSIVTFGSYEQDDNLENDKEPVEWIIIDRDKEKAMLISKKIIEREPFWGSGIPIAPGSPPWENSGIRKKLNSTFYSELFSANEQKRIINTKIIPDEKIYSTSPNQGNTTYDKIFLLSEKEFLKYEKAIGTSCEVTKYVEAQYIKAHEDKSTIWWLRSTSDDYDSDKELVNENGRVIGWNEGSSGGVRPVVWVSFE